MKLKTGLLAVLLFTLANITFGQQTAPVKKSSIKGKVLDATTGETLPGVIAMIEGTTSAGMTDLDGNFTIPNLIPGTYKVTFRFISYETKVLSDVVVTADKPSNLSVSLKGVSTELTEVVVQASAKRESVASMLIMQKNSASVSDGISAETIKTKPDKNAGDVLKRVSGASIQENKFAIIRGLNDRYNAAFINGAPLPSSESDRKAFAFDIFPAALLDNITIIKSATPEMPADFAGGVIQINTRAIPEENSQSLSISGGYNTLTTFKESYSYDGGKYDWLGLGNKARKLPDGIPNTTEFAKYTSTQKAEKAKLMDNDWALTQLKSTAPAFNLQYTLAIVDSLFGNEIGSIFALTYSNTNTTNKAVRREFDELDSGATRPLQIFELTDKQYTNNVLAGIIWNISYKIKDNTKISFKNLLNVNTEDKVIMRDAIQEFNSSDPDLQKASARWFTENLLYSSQLGGEHYLPKKKLKVNWILGYSNIERNIPNLRRMLYTYDATLDTPKYVASIPTTGTSITSGGNIFYSSNKEQVYSAGYDLTIPLSFIPFKSDLKLGGYHQLRDRDFSSRQLGFSRFTQLGKVKFDNSLLYLPEDEIFSQENLGIIQPYQAAYTDSLGVFHPQVMGKGGFKIDETTKLNDAYQATSTIHAGYIMLDNKFTKKLRLIWGARLESFNQTLESFEDDGTEVHIDTTKVDVLPSGNFVYALTEESNLRLSYAQTVSRPEFRELAPFGFYDFVTNYTVRGNPDTKRALIHNFDFRYELFPRGGQLISASFFYKKFIDAIEQINRADLGRTIYYQNVPEANNLGIELEGRFSLGYLFGIPDSNFLSKLTVFANVALIKSEINVGELSGSEVAKRALQGQSPFIVNAGALYNDLDKKFSISYGLNIVGRRIAIVGSSEEPDIYENPRAVMDLQITKTIFKNLEIKLNCKDLLAKKTFFYEDLNDNKKMDEDIDNIMSETTNGQTITLGLSYKF